MVAGDCTATRGNYSDFPCNVFDGVDDYVEIPHNTAQLGANLSNGFTISAWINPRSIGEANGVILDKSTDPFAANGFCLRMGIDKFGFRINSDPIDESAASSVIIGRWTHILITYTSALKLNMYANGVLSGTANRDNGNTALITTTNAMRIGNRATVTDRAFDGGIRSVKMWNRVLTTAEISQDYAGIKITDGLIHNFKLGGDYADYGEVGVTATNSGSVANNTIENKIVTDTSQINLAAATGKLIAIPAPDRDATITMIGVNRAT